MTDSPVMGPVSSGPVPSGQTQAQPIRTKSIPTGQTATQPRPFVKQTRRSSSSTQVVSEKSHPRRSSSDISKRGSVSGSSVTTATKVPIAFGPPSHTRQIGRAVQQECRDRSRMPSSA
eukprot:TRINITY_DN22417_c0_g1_i20.p1 TRINITY_DN22417_c0_g1~~TRINITY_DN22417_c0_g1_i20.p1  ORF type:complete len:136 (+),score=7.90 TRINITY_DN22417_c0_g1_i20:55-408(+)